jgi:hypothetical protein
MALPYGSTQYIPTDIALQEEEALLMLVPAPQGEVLIDCSPTAVLAMSHHETLVVVLPSLLPYTS